MKILGDYHTHSTLSHGEGTVEDNIKKAASLGLKQIAITDHGISHIAFGLTERKLKKARIEIEKLKQKYDIDILLGAECNLISHNGLIDLPQQSKLDIVLLGYHYTAKPKKMKDLRLYRYAWLSFIKSKHSEEYCTECYINAIKNNDIDVVTHLNKCIKVDCKAIAEVCAETGTYIELSSRHPDLKNKDIEDILSTKAEFIINSDAHMSEDIGNVSYAYDKVKEFDMADRVVNLNRIPKFRSQG